MAAISKTQLSAQKREEILNLVTDFFLSREEDVQRANGNSITFPATDAAGNELFVKITVSIPRGSWLDGEAYDGYAEAEEYKLRKQEKAEREAETARKKELAAKKRAEAQAERQKQKARKKTEEES